MKKDISIAECELLANAVILQAVNDYETALAVLNTEYIIETEAEEKRITDKKIDAASIKFDCEHFFRSDWFKVLTTAEPEALIYGINESVRNAPMIPYNEEKKKYLCICGRGVRIRKDQKGSPVIKCGVCKRYWRVFGKPITSDYDNFDVRR